MRKQLKNYQTKYEALKKIRQTLQKLHVIINAPSGQVDFSAQQKIELDILDQYEQLRSKTRSDADRI